MRQTIEFYFDLSVVIVLVYVGGAREHILALWVFIFTFSQDLMCVLNWVSSEHV